MMRLYAPPASQARLLGLALLRPTFHPRQASWRADFRGLCVLGRLADCRPLDWLVLTSGTGCPRVGQVGRGGWAKLFTLRRTRMRSMPRTWFLLTMAVVMGGAGRQALADTDDLAARIAAAGDAKDYPKADCVVVYDDTGVLVRPNGLATTEQRRVLKILTDAGVKAQAVQTFDFDPVTNRFQVKRIRLHRADGAVETVDLRQIITAPASAWGIYWGSMFQTIAVSRLAVNDCIEVITSRTGFNLAYLDEDVPGPTVGAEHLEPPMPGHWHDTITFQESYPVIEKRFSARLPRDKPLQYEVCHGQLQTTVRFEGDQTVYTFVGEDLAVLKREPRMVATSDAALKLVLATVPDWEAKCKWFHDANVNQFEITPEIQAKVDEIIAGIDDDTEKIRAINCWVADNVRYVGTTRGVTEGYTLHTGDETFRDRGGVCKDKAGMGITMLRAAGFDTYPVMTQAGSDVEYTPADQFNHCVGAVRFDDGRLMLVDPTWSPKSREIWSSREALQYVVYGLPEGHDLDQSPYFPPEHNAATCTARSRIEPGGRLETRLSVGLTGYPDTYFRRRFLGAHIPEQRGVVEGWVSRLGAQTSLVDLSHTDPWDYSQDVKIDATVLVDGYALGHGGLRMFRLPMLQQPFASTYGQDIVAKIEENKDRKFGYRMRATRLLTYSDTLDLPPGWKVEDVPDKVEIDNEAARLTFTAEARDGALHYSFVIAIKHSTIPAEHYAGFYEVNKKMHELAESWVVCSVNGTTGSPVAEADTKRKEVVR